MSGPQILTIIHFVGWGFIFLWIMATGFKLGMWNNALLFFNWSLAELIAVPISFPASRLILGAVGPDPGDLYTPFAVWAGMFWLTIFIAFLGMQTFTESFSKVKVTFHPVVETLGSLVFSFGTFLVLAGATMPMLHLVRSYID